MKKNKSYRIQSDFPLMSEWLPPEVFEATYSNLADAIAIAIEGFEDGDGNEVRVICNETDDVVWRSTSIMLD